MTIEIEKDRRIAELEKQVQDLRYALCRSDGIRVDMARLLECARAGLSIATRLTDDERVSESAAIVDRFFRGEP